MNRPGRRPTVRCLALAFVSGLACTVQADPLLGSPTTCQDLTAFVTRQQAPVLAGQTATCTTSRVLGGAVSLDCYWAFPYRADAARHLYEDLTTTLRHCVEGAAAPDQAKLNQARFNQARVNHPDSYDQITAPLMGHSVSVSLKDKGALGRSLVFLRSAKQD